MATTVPVDSSRTATGNVAPMTQAQNVYVMPVQEGFQSRIVRPVPGVKCLSIATIVIGGMLVVLGFIAIGLKAQNSYIANPIWTGLLFMVTTGILGVFVYQKKNNMCMNIGFLVMTIISSVFAYQLFECVMAFTMSEWEYECVPGPHHYFYNCSPKWARVLVGVAIILCSVAALVLCIVSCSVTIYGTFTCCYNCCSCCRNASSSSMVQYSPHTGIAMTPMHGQGMQVMAGTQVTPQGVPATQQTTHQPLLVASPQPYQPYPQIVPPAYMASPNMGTRPQNSVVSSDQKGAHVIVSAATGPPSDNIKVTEDKSLATAPPAETVPTTTSGQIADSPQNWQTF